VTSIEELADIIETSGGYVYTGWSGDPAVEERIKEKTGATLRCIPDEEFRSAESPSKCIGGDDASKMEVLWARAY
jgi:prolyl-tRNA synthetase